MDFFNILENDEQARSALVSILNYFECISLGVIHVILDESFIKDYFKSIYRTYLNNYSFYIEHRRNVHNSPMAWINYTTLAEKWRKEG